MGDQGFRPCGPMWMDGQWWLAEIDHDLRMLTIAATADGERFDTYAVDLAGTWQDALPGGSGLGTANLYHDGDLIVLRLCRASDGFPCALSVDLELDTSLLGGATRPADDPYSPTDLAMPPPIINAAFDIELVQLGDELWSVQVESFPNGDSSYKPNLPRAGRYGRPLEQVDGARVDVRLRYGQVMRCIYDDVFPGEPPTTCETQLADGTWRPVHGTIAVDWASVPAGTPVSFFDRTADGRIMVVPS